VAGAVRPSNADWDRAGGKVFANPRLHRGEPHTGLAVAEQMRILLKEFADLADVRTEPVTRAQSRPNARLHEPSRSLPQRSRKWPLPWFTDASCRISVAAHPGESAGRLPASEEVRSRFPGDEGASSALAFVEEGGAQIRNGISPSSARTALTGRRDPFRSAAAG